MANDSLKVTLDSRMRGNDDYISRRPHPIRHSRACGNPVPELLTRALRRIILALAVFVILSTSALAATPGEVLEGQTLREAPLYGFAGDFRKLSELRGKPLIINVWASWCAPCRAEMGSLERLAKRYGGKQFNVVGISTDDDADAAAEFLTQANITFDNYLDRNVFLENMLGANTIPLTILVDAKGKVLKKVRGTRQWDNAENLDLIAKTLNVKL